MASRGNRLVAACSPLAAERAHAREQLGVASVYNDLGLLQQDKDVDAVVHTRSNSTSTALQYPMADQPVTAGSLPIGSFCGSCQQQSLR